MWVTLGMGRFLILRKEVIKTIKFLLREGPELQVCLWCPPMNQDLVNRGIFDVPDDLVLCAEGVCPDKCLQLKYQGNITYWYYFQAKGDFRWVKTGLEALRKLGNRG